MAGKAEPPLPASGLLSEEAPLRGVEVALPGVRNRRAGSEGREVFTMGKAVGEGRGNAAAGGEEQGGGQEGAAP